MSTSALLLFPSSEALVVGLNSSRIEAESFEYIDRGIIRHSLFGRIVSSADVKSLLHCPTDDMADQPVSWYIATRCSMQTRQGETDESD